MDTLPVKLRSAILIVTDMEGQSTEFVVFPSDVEPLTLTLGQEQGIIPDLMNRTLVVGLLQAVKFNLRGGRFRARTIRETVAVVQIEQGD